MEIKKNVNRDKRIVTAYIVNDGKTYVGMAKCAPSEEFDEVRGFEIAKRRAMIELKNDDIKEINCVRSYFESQVQHYDASIRRAKKKIRQLYDEIHEYSVGE